MKDIYFSCGSNNLFKVYIINLYGLMFKNPNINGEKFVLFPNLILKEFFSRSYFLLEFNFFTLCCSQRNSF